MNKRAISHYKYEPWDSSLSWAENVQTTEKRYAKIGYPLISAWLLNEAISTAEQLQKQFSSYNFSIVDEFDGTIVSYSVVVLPKVNQDKRNEMISYAISLKEDTNDTFILSSTTKKSKLPVLIKDGMSEMDEEITLNKKSNVKIVSMKHPNEEEFALNELKKQPTGGTTYKSSFIDDKDEEPESKTIIIKLSDVLKKIKNDDGFKKLIKNKNVNVHLDAMRFIDVRHRILIYEVTINNWSIELQIRFDFINKQFVIDPSGDIFKENDAAGLIEYLYTATTNAVASD